MRHRGLLEPLLVPKWKWKDISMDFITGMPMAVRGYNTFWVIVDRLTKSIHLLPIQLSYTAEKLGEIYLREMERLHRVPYTIVSDRDARFTARFWRRLQEAMGTKLLMGTTFHPQTGGQTERTIQTVDDMLMACALEMKESWPDHLLLVEFSYNNIYQ